MNGHDLLASLDAALLLVRDPARRILARHAELAAMMDERMSLLFRYGMVHAAIEAVHGAAARSRAAWGCHRSPAADLVQVARDALVAVAVVLTPEEIGRFLSELQRQLDAQHPTPVEGGPQT